jgi:hypothetical protein
MIGYVNSSHPRSSLELEEAEWCGLLHANPMQRCSNVAFNDREAMEPK